MEVQAILGIVNYNIQFIQTYCRVLQPLAKLMSKFGSFDEGLDGKRIFAELKISFTTAQVLAQFHHEKEIVLGTDIYSYISTGVLLLYNDQKILYPIAFFYTDHSPASETVDILNSEQGMQAIIL
jgi:hypothetical protein